MTSVDRHLLALVGTVLLASFPMPARAQRLCVGDCDGNGAISIDELITGVNIALDRDVLSSCSDFDVDHDGGVQISELLGAVRGSVEGCRAPDPTPTPTPEDFVAEATDFECLTNWTRVRHFRITNTLGHLDEALAVAHGDESAPYPVGTIIQLVPGEAMVKRGAGFFPDGRDWEFFVLGASSQGTEILKRGRDEVVNIGIPCFACHNAAAQKDLICETANGCIALNLPEDLINRLQDTDPRCTASAAAH